MTMSADLERALKMRVIPVVEIHDADLAGPLADALAAGGLPCAEITLRTSAGVDAIRQLSGRSDMVVGAGTVLSVVQAGQAVDNGACFVVSPGLNPKVVQFCGDRNVPVLPGVCTPSDITAAFELGLSLLKFFPAEAFGGLKTLNAISAPFPMMRFVPTGGIDAGNLCTYLSHPKVAACGGSWMVKSKLISERRFSEITQLTREAVALAKPAQRETSIGGK
jgi:2-dehydro-3-deoxyphosphogluconate aldolase / (4S)-4-hydroxy-2-oxoglutarate aldolase